MAPFDPILPTFSGLNLNHQNDHQHCPSLRNTKPSKKPSTGFLWDGRYPQPPQPPQPPPLPHPHSGRPEALTQAREMLLFRPQPWPLNVWAVWLGDFRRLWPTQITRRDSRPDRTTRSESLLGVAPQATTTSTSSSTTSATWQVCAFNAAIPVELHIREVTDTSTTNTTTTSTRTRTARL